MALDALTKKKSNAAKRKPGRPRKRATGGRPEKELSLEAVQALAKSGAPLETIAEALGVTRKTLYSRRKKDPEFAKAMQGAYDMGEAEFWILLHQKYAEQIRRGNTRIIMHAMDVFNALKRPQKEADEWLYKIFLPDGAFLLVPRDTNPLDVLDNVQTISRQESSTDE